MQSWWLLLLSTVLLLAWIGGSSASTSSKLLRHTNIAKGRIPSEIGRSVLQNGRQSLVTGRRKAFGGTSSGTTTSWTKRSYAAISPAAAAAGFVGNSAAVRSGFRQFSQRATRLQGRTRKPFSLRSIFGDCVTNNNNNNNNNNDPGAIAGEDVLPVVKRLQPLLSALTSMAAQGASEAFDGFLGGYLLGAAAHSTKRLYFEIKQTIFSTSKPPIPLPTITATTTSATTSISTLPPYSSITKLRQQSLQFHSHNMKWAIEWGKISAVFGASRMLVKTLRSHDDDSDDDLEQAEEDGWNNVLGSAMAGAILAAAAPSSSPLQQSLLLAPVPMTRGALLYGGSMFLLHPHLWKPALDVLWLTLQSSDSIDQPWYDRIATF